MKTDQVEVTVEAVETTQEVTNLLAYLRRYQSREAANSDASLKSSVVMADQSLLAYSQELTAHLGL